MNRLCLALISILLAAGPTVASAQFVTSGTIAVSGGGALLEGDQPAFQQRLRQRKEGFGGIENFTAERTSEEALFRFEARVLPGNEDYRIAARWERFDAVYVQANYTQFRTFYDGSGGVLRPAGDLAISWFDENLALDRSYLSLEIGTLTPDRPQWRLRYDRNTRDGTKNSLRWGDSNLGGAGLTPRAFVPSYLLVDEVRDIVTAEAGQRTDDMNWKVAGRYERTRVDNRHTARRRPLEPQDRYVTMHEGMTMDLFSGHAFIERVLHEKARWSAGGLITSIDTDVVGSKIYGPTPDSEYSATFARRQTGDVGYYGLSGGTRMKQYLGNFNIVYQPTKYLVVRPGLRYEHLRQESGEGHTDTDFGPGAAAAAIQRQIEASSRNSWNEFTEELEVRYTRWQDWTLSARAQLNQGTGNLVEQSVLVPTQARIIDRDTDYERFGQRYLLNATWYFRPGLTLAGSYSYRLKIADYEHVRDSSNNGGFDRYPAFIIDNDLETHDANFRLSWRPRVALSLVTRYAHQRTVVTTTMAGLPEIENGKLMRHALSQTATWTPTARLYFTGAVNVTYDQLWVPPHRLTFPSDNNYISAMLGAGYAVGKVTDLYLDVNHYRADNYTDNSLVTLPMHAGNELQSAFLTWVRRHTDRIIYTAKYGYARNRDGTYAGLNDFDAHIFYAKVQYKF